MLLLDGDPHRDAGDVERSVAIDAQCADALDVNYHPRVGQSSVTGDLSKTISLGMEMIGLVIKTRIKPFGPRPRQAAATTSA